ncbi:MAG: hypothetical protein ACKVQJ_07175 [Pyrinomonadaceae bacterium]
MKEAIFILLVVIVLAALTAVRYRKQIAAIMGFARMLREAKDSVRGSRAFPNDNAKSIPLVNCTACGIWVPQNKSRKIGDVFYCSDDCLQIQKSAR